MPLLTQMGCLALHLKDATDMHTVCQRSVERICHTSVLHVRKLRARGEKPVSSGLYFLLQDTG